MAANGDVYYQRRDEATHEFHLYRTAWRDGQYQPPQRLALGDPAAHELDPAIAPDQSFIVFDANYAGKDQPDRLYIAFREGDAWSKPIDLGDAVNRYEPWGSHLGPDGRTLYFTSNYTAKVSYPRTPRRRARTWRACARGTTATTISGACRWRRGWMRTVRCDFSPGRRAATPSSLLLQETHDT